MERNKSGDDLHISMGHGKIYKSPSEGSLDDEDDGKLTVNLGRFGTQIGIHGRIESEEDSVQTKKNSNEKKKKRGNKSIKNIVTKRVKRPNNYRHDDMAVQTYLPRSPRKITVSVMAGDKSPRSNKFEYNLAQHNKKFFQSSLSNYESNMNIR